MSKHKFTSDRSDMAHRIKMQLRSSTAVQPPPMEELPRSRWGEADVLILPRNSGKTEAYLREMISNPKVEIKEKPRGA